MSTCSLGTHLSLSPMIAQPSKKGRGRNGHAPSASTVCHSAPTRGGLRRSLPRPACRSCRRWPCPGAHDLTHLLLGRGTQLGDDLLNQASSSSPETCAGSRLSRILTCSGQVVGTLLVGAGLDGHLQRLARLLDQTLDHAVDVFLGHIAALVDLDILHLGLNLANDGQANLVLGFMAAIISFCSSSLVICKSSLIAWAELTRAPPHDYSASTNRRS